MFLVQVLTTLAFVTFVNGSVLFALKPQGSNENQYKRRKGNEGTGHVLVEKPRSNDDDATDRDLIPARQTHENAQGLPKGRPFPNSYLAQHVKNSSHEPVDKSTEASEQNRNKRSYYIYQAPKFQSISAWRSSLYPVPRQYFLPIYGVEGRKTIYLPQQQIYVAQGTYKNSIKTTYVTPSTVVVIPSPNSRFGYDDDNEDRPMWDKENEPVLRPKRTQPSLPPTKKPEPKVFPPTTYKEKYNSSNNINHLSAIGDRRHPEIKSTKQHTHQGPSKCVWAIVSCCSTSSNDINYNCFNQCGCSGPFLDGSPCDAEVVKKAIESAMNFYNSKSKRDRPTVINVG